MFLHGHWKLPPPYSKNRPICNAQRALRFFSTAEKGKHSKKENFRMEDLRAYAISLGREPAQIRGTGT
jgi:hypothetical protein